MKSYRHILCATDFSPFCDRACSEALTLARQADSALTLLHVVDHFPVDRSNDEIAPEDVDPREYRERKARLALEAQAGRTDCREARHEISFSTDAAAHEIVRYAGTADVDLIVVASHGHKGWRKLFGSTASAVQHHAPCEVMVIPADVG